ncbi:uncharacterized protein LOC115887734 [Sitophilus oryzae]|uniref:Uncharacterized protein LOC115887734 n=1 Tax=Sitophilus oryzae TaxID=7048 RepID=A0A6J2YGE5_SITOR|nr:uncharacterized protein LOC115887734 [Sitophilus oryzae]
MPMCLRLCLNSATGLCASTPSRQETNKDISRIGGLTFSEIDKTTILEFEARFERYQGILSEFDGVQEKIELCKDDDEFYEQQTQEREQFEQTYFQLISKGKSFLDDYHQDIKQNNDNYSDTNSNHSRVSNHDSRQTENVKLPEIKLPKFSGQYENWLEFRDTFDSLINSNNNLSKIQKFHYLRSALESSAAQVITSIEFCADNYTVAWDTLLARFNNGGVLVYNHVKSIFDMQPLNFESAVELRRILDSLAKHLRALKILKQPTESWDTLLIYIITNKLDKKTSREWEERRVKLCANQGQSSSDSINLPTLIDFKNFLKQKADLLETLNLMSDKPVKSSRSTHLAYKTDQQVSNNESQAKPVSQKNIQCVFCKSSSHFIHNCTKFLELCVNDRIEKVRSLKLCTNCLRGNHFSKNCFAGNCRKCRGRHNTLLHLVTKSGERTRGDEQNGAGDSRTTDQTKVFNCASNRQNSCESTILLSTALIQVLSRSGEWQECRVLLDSASQSNFVTKECCDRLGLETSRANISVVGINQAISDVNQMCQISLRSMSNSFKSEVSCLVIPVINNFVPELSFDSSDLNIPKNLRLADPRFNKSNKIDILLGASIFYDLLCIGQVRLGNGKPTLQKSVLGWLVSGSVSSPPNSKTICKHVSNLELQNQIKAFWEVEEIQSKQSTLSEQEKQCEELFQKTTRRDRDGRFIVQIPFQKSPSLLGESREVAQKRLCSVQFKLSKDSTMKQHYTDFMQEYLELGHMQLSKSNSEQGYFLPHHGVFKEQNQTTKLRVVFDASARTDSGLSLNELQCVGPTIQDDLVSILLRFRQYQVVVCADIIKMYRQILIDPSQRCFQKILWGISSNEPVQEYELNTVTYGMASSPWLSVRCLKQLALENSDVYPRSSEIISKDFYMDDLFTGGDTPGEVIKICSEVTDILQSGCFPLQKWASNNSEVLKHVKASNPSAIFKLGDGEKTKTLGIFWASSEDLLRYHISNPSSKAITKRTVLSDIAQIFDPLGLLGPCVVIGKIIMQKLWILKVSWDESLPSDLDTKWRLFRRQLLELNKVELPRCVICHSSKEIQIHGFSDASTEAYGACIYIRSSNSMGDVFVRLLCAKTRVAPLKSLTIPRLELCGALLLAQLFDKVKSSLNLSFTRQYFWSDSSICIAWIKTEPRLLQVFVQNRVSQIQNIINPIDWRHISGKDNPADLLSRGVNPSELEAMSLWWSGPPWLQKSPSDWPKSLVEFKGELPEKRKEVVTYSVQLSDPFPMTRFSSFKRLQRVVAWCLRFMSNCKKPKTTRIFEPLSAIELDQATKYLVIVSQRESFGQELTLLAKNKPLQRGTRILSLNPFIDRDCVLRVGGRLQESSATFDKKHPAILSGSHILTKLFYL